MRTVCISLLLIFSFQISNSQPKLRAVLQKKRLGYNAGDTILLSGYFAYNTNHPNHYYTKSVLGTNRFIAPSLVKIIDTLNGFWDNKWYLYRSGEIAKKGYKLNIRNQLNSNCIEYINYLKNNDLLETDSTMNTYVSNLLFTICSTPLYKGIHANLNIKIIKTEEYDIFSSDNGTIFITTGAIAKQPNEEALAKILTNEIAHIVCDHQFKNEKEKVDAQTAGCIFLGAVAVVAVVAIAANSTNTDNNSDNSYSDDTNFFSYMVNDVYSPSSQAYSPPKVKVKYSEDQIALAKQITSNYIVKKYSTYEHLGEYEFTKNIAGAITPVAWYNFHHSKYKEALALVNRLENAGLSGTDDYLLKAKIYRILYQTDEGSYEALKYLQMAKDASPQTNIDIVKEEGLVYYQLKDKEKARACFEEYKYALKELGINDNEDKKELEWIERMIQNTL